MNRVSGRIIAVMVLALLLAMAVHQYAAKVRRTDRAEYLAEQGRRYDRQQAHPHSIVVEIIVSGFLVGGAVLAYEIIAFGAFKLLNLTTGADRDLGRLPTDRDRQI